MPFLAFLLGQPGPQRWASPCPGPLGPWDAHPSPTSAGCPFSLAWPAHCHPWKLPSLPLSLMQQVGSSCLRCCTLKPSPPLGSCLLCPCSSIIPSPLAQGCSPPTRGRGLAFTSGILLLQKRGPLGFLAASCSAVSPPSTPSVGEEQGEGAQSSFAFLRAGLHTPVCGAGLCLSSLCPGSSPPSPLQPVCDSQPWCATPRGPQPAFPQSHSGDQGAGVVPPMAPWTVMESWSCRAPR
ncbi:PREDICTED: uncharacterized protein LOC101384031 [Odobenus rosmarus divergens]|uniref:Uncharacterized protein LOC101384031 n=1 Tax=Odobenus rosmarus divergens TaxID=9708 RepID=A0A9B0LY93_ODORO